LIELLVQQPGMGELQLLKPALRHIAQHGRIALIQPPHLPQIAAFNAWGIAIENLLWIKTQRSADALWAAEQILRHGCCGAVLLWQTHVHTNALRRLHLAVQATDTAFWMIRPLALGADASPASLRLALRPDLGGVQVDVIKRRGPRLAAPFYLALPDMPFSTEVLKKVPKVPSCVYG
jgi:protein ImuA